MLKLARFSPFTNHQFNVFQLTLNEDRSNVILLRQLIALLQPASSVPQQVLEYRAPQLRQACDVTALLFGSQGRFGEDAVAGLLELLHRLAHVHASGCTERNVLLLCKKK